MCFRSSRAFRAYEKGRAIARTALVFRRFSACSAFSAITRIAVATSPSAYRVAATRIAVGMNAAHRTLPYDAAHPALPQTERIEQATAVAVVAVTAILAVLAAAILAVAVIVVAVVLPRIFMPRPFRRFMDENTPRLKQVLPMVSVRCVEMFFHKEILIPTGPWSVRGERCFRKDFSEDF